MRATAPREAPAPTHTITGPARVFWADRDTDGLTGQQVTARKTFPSHETAHIPCRLADGRWCLVPAKNLRPL